MINKMYIENRESALKNTINERDSYPIDSEVWSDINRIVEYEQEMIEMYYMCHKLKKS